MTLLLRQYKPTLNFYNVVFRDPPFQPKPSLSPVVEYFSKIIRKWPTEMCPCCGEKALPEDPKVGTKLAKISTFWGLFTLNICVCNVANKLRFTQFTAVNSYCTAVLQDQMFADAMRKKYHLGDYKLKVM